jgi:hypothetical protein
MAISQFYLVAIPKEGIIEYFGEIPTKLEVGFNKRTENFLNGNEEEFDYFEFIQHKCWSLSKINSNEIIDHLDQKLPRANWGNESESNKWKNETEDFDNDAWILTCKETSQIIEFTFRADLRQHDLKFLIEMIKLSKTMKLLLVDIKGNLVQPEIGSVFELVRKSNALRFVEDPRKYLTDLEKGEVEIE